MIGKYKKAELPSKDEAIAMAREREEWAATAREKDLAGTAWEFELSALLLRFYGERDVT